MVQRRDRRRHRVLINAGTAPMLEETSRVVRERLALRDDRAQPHQRQVWVGVVWATLSRPLVVVRPQYQVQPP